MNKKIILLAITLISGILITVSFAFPPARTLRGVQTGSAVKAKTFGSARTRRTSSAKFSSSSHGSKKKRSSKKPCGDPDDGCGGC